MPQHGTLDPCNEKKVRMCYTELKANIDASDFVDIFYSKDVFSLDEKEQIVNCMTRADKAECFLMKFLRSGNGNSFSVFMEVLKQKYPQLAKQLNEKKVDSNNCDSQSYYSWFSEVSEEKKRCVIKTATALELSDCLSENWQLVFEKLGFTSCEIEQEYLFNYLKDKKEQIANLLTKKKLQVGDFVEVLKKIEDNKLAMIDWVTLESIVKK